MPIKFKHLPPDSAVQEITRGVLLDHRGSLQDAADLLGWPRTTLDSHLNPHKVKALNWDAVRASYAITRDARLAELLVPAGFEVRISADAVEPGGDVASEIADVSDAAGILRNLTKQAQEDGEVTPEEAEALAEKFKDLETQFAEAKKALQNQGVKV